MHTCQHITSRFGPPGHDGSGYLKDRFNCEYLILRFGYPTHFAGTYNCGIAKTTDHTH